MKMQTVGKSANLRNMLLSILFLSLIFSIGYKYYEWSTLNKLSRLYNASWNKELNLTESENKNLKVYNILLGEVFSSKNFSDELIASYDELVGSLKLVAASEEEYRKTLEKNKQDFNQISTMFLVGNRGKFAKKLVDDHLKYYFHGLDNVNYLIAERWLAFNMLSVWKDLEIVDKFSGKIQKNASTNIPKYFADISILEKYTNNSFKFEHEDFIKQYLPNGFETLNRYKSYFSTFYSVTKDMVNEDYESVQYKLSKLGETRTNLNINFVNLFKEGEEKRIENTQNIIQLMVDEVYIIGDFKRKDMGRYPLLAGINNWESDLVACRMYQSKSWVYYNITSKYVVSKTFKDLLVEFSSIPPSTDLIDDSFNTEVVNFTNDDKSIVFKCTGRMNNTYTFETTK
jgi:hypothetical protein